MQGEEGAWTFGDGTKGKKQASSSNFLLYELIIIFCTGLL